MLIHNDDYLDAFGLFSEKIDKVRFGDVIFESTGVVESRTVTVNNVANLIDPVIWHECA